MNSYNKQINRIEISINDKYKINNKEDNDRLNHSDKPNITFIEDSFLKYNRIDPNKNFNNFILGSSNKLAFEASKKITEDLSHYNPLYLYGGVGDR